MLKDLTSLIIRHTSVSRNHLTPEIALRLITPSCPLWTARDHEVPFPDPFWAFYWPGGQATARYILDNGVMIRNRRVLDLGCGCGAGAIAAAKMAAKHIVANDIDPYAISAAQINMKLNDVIIETDTTNLVGLNLEEFDTILVGDMFYDEEFAEKLFNWLHNLSAKGKNVLLGDPGRHGLTARRRQQMSPLATYKLTPHSCRENSGFTHSTVWNINQV